MNPKGLLAAVAVLALLGGGVWWSNREEREKAGKPPADAPPKVLVLAEGDIQKVEIKRAAGESTTLQRTNGNWKLVSPDFAIDREALNQFFTALSSLSSEKVADDKATDLKPFGLAEPGTRIIITLNSGKTRTVSFGDDAPVGGGTYVAADGDPRVFVISSMTRASLDKMPADLRDKRLLTFVPDRVAQLAWAAKGATIEFSRSAAGDWTIVKPRPLRADGWQIEEMIRKLNDAKLDPLLTSDQKADLARQFAAAAPFGTATVTDAGAVQKLELRKNKDGKLYARSSVVDGFHLLAGDFDKAFDKSIDDLRNKKVFDFGFSDPNRVEVKDGARTVTLAKAGDRWLSGTKPMDSVGVQSLIDRLRDLSASKFADTGFTTPQVDITVVSKDGKLTEKVSLSKVGDNYFARREGEASLYELDAKTVTELTKAAFEIKEQPATPAKK